MGKLTDEEAKALQELQAKADAPDDDDPTDVWEEGERWGAKLKGSALDRFLKRHNFSLADDEEATEATVTDDPNPPKLKAAPEPRRFGGRRVS